VNPAALCCTISLVSHRFFSILAIAKIDGILHLQDNREVVLVSSPESVIRGANLGGLLAKWLPFLRRREKAVLGVRQSVLMPSSGSYRPLRHRTVKKTGRESASLLDRQVY